MVMEKYLLTNPPATVYVQISVAERHIAPAMDIFKKYAIIVPIPTKLPASKQMKLIMVQIETKISTTFPYLLAKTSGKVSAKSSLILPAKKMAFRISDIPKPIGITAPSQKWYL